MVEAKNVQIDFTEHSEMTSPGKHAHAINQLSDEITLLLKTVRGLFVHGDFLGFYELSSSDYSSYSRETLSLEKRLSLILRKSSRPLANSRPYNLREVGTCRDYALMACGMLREKSIPARV